MPGSSGEGKLTETSDQSHQAPPRATGGGPERRQVNGEADVPPSGSARRENGVDRLPLQSVRAFVVVGRLLSVSDAAKELNVTPSAVSHQIRTLEEYLGTPLFRREKNALKLTAAGQQYMSQVSEGLLLLSRATKTLRAKKEQQTLRVGITPGLASLWLIPRLHRFTRAHPEIAVDLTAVPDTAPLAHTAFDAAFWYGSGAIAGLSTDPLGANRMFPICKPGFVKGEHSLRTPSDLAKCTLLESGDETYHQRREPVQLAWAEWLQAAGVPEVTGRRHMRFTPRLLLYDAVVAGLGVGLASTLLAIDGLAARDVVVPFGPALPRMMTYNFVCPGSLVKRRDISAFRDWVIAEAHASTKKAERILKPHIA